MNHIPKYKIPVRVSIAEEGVVIGAVFLRQEQRILDMLCDPNQFFPISTKAGMLLINKASVLKVQTLDKEFIEQNEDSFPDEDVSRDFETHEKLTRHRRRSRQLS